MAEHQPCASPRHVAIIMDGNGRWAEARGLPRSAGHKAGIDALRRAVRTASDEGIEVLSVYAFSTENWQRPKREIMFLFDLLNRFIKQDVAELHASGVQIKIIGSRVDLDAKVIKQLEYAEHLTAGNTKLKLVVAFNYGARQELAQAAKMSDVAVTDSNNLFGALEFSEAASEKGIQPIIGLALTLDVNPNKADDNKFQKDTALRRVT